MYAPGSLNIGYRKEISRTLVKRNVTGEFSVLSAIPVGEMLREPRGIELVTALISILKGIHSPFTEPISSCELLSSSESLIIVRPFKTMGSLRDILYKTKPLLNRHAKYGRGCAPFPLDTVALIGR